MGEIKKTVDVLQEQTKQVQHSFEKSKQDVATTVAKAGQARSVFNAIISAFGQINSANDHIASASKEQSVVTEDISNNITQIKIMSEDTSKIASGLLHETDSLEEAIRSLNSVVN